MADDTALNQLRTKAHVAVPPSIKSDEDLWRELGLNRSGELEALSKMLKVGEAEVLEAMTAAALAYANEAGPHWLRRHWFDSLWAAVLAGAVLLVFALVARGLPRSTAPQVVAARELSPYHVITHKDIAVRESPRTAGALTDPASAPGRYTILKLSAGDVLTQASLSAGKLANGLGGAAIIALPVKNANKSLQWTFPSEVTVIITPRSGAAGRPIVAPAHLLAFESSESGASAVLAFDAKLLPDIAAAAGNSDVMLAWQ